MLWLPGEVCFQLAVVRVGVTDIAVWFGKLRQKIYETEKRYCKFD